MLGGKWNDLLGTGQCEPHLYLKGDGGLGTCEKMMKVQEPRQRSGNEVEQLVIKFEANVVGATDFVAITTEAQRTALAKATLGQLECIGA